MFSALFARVLQQNSDPVATQCQLNKLRTIYWLSSYNDFLKGPNFLAFLPLSGGICPFACELVTALTKRGRQYWDHMISKARLSKSISFSLVLSDTHSWGTQSPGKKSDSIEVSVQARPPADALIHRPTWAPRRASGSTVSRRNEPSGTSSLAEPSNAGRLRGYFTIEPFSNFSYTKFYAKYNGCCFMPLRSNLWHSSDDCSISLPCISSPLSYLCFLELPSK